MLRLEFWSAKCNCDCYGNGDVPLCTFHAQFNVFIRCHLSLHLTPNPSSPNSIPCVNAPLPPTQTPPTKPPFKPSKPPLQIPPQNPPSPQSRQRNHPPSHNPINQRNYNPNQSTIASETDTTFRNPKPHEPPHLLLPLLLATPLPPPPPNPPHNPPHASHNPKSFPRNQHASPASRVPPAGPRTRCADLEMAFRVATGGRGDFRGGEGSGE